VPCNLEALRGAPVISSSIAGIGNSDEVVDSSAGVGWDEPPIGTIPLGEFGAGEDPSVEPSGLEERGH